MSRALRPFLLLLLAGCPPPVRRDQIEPLSLTGWVWGTTLVLEKSSSFGPPPISREIAGVVFFSCSIVSAAAKEERWVWYRIDLGQLFRSVTNSLDSIAAGRWWVQDGRRELILQMASKDRPELLLVGHLESDSLVGWWHQNGNRSVPWARGQFVMRRLGRYQDRACGVGA
jgi:hypothetical protein